MGKIGVTELLVVLAIVLVIFGPKALPKLGKTIGQAIGNFRKGASDVLDDDDEKEAAKKKTDDSSDE